MGEIEKAIQQIVKEELNRVLESLKPDLPAPSDDEILTTQEAADYLRISKKTLYTLCREKRIKHIRNGSLNSRKPVLTFRKSALDEYILTEEQQNYRKEAEG